MNEDEKQQLSTALKAQANGRGSAPPRASVAENMRKDAAVATLKLGQNTEALFKDKSPEEIEKLLQQVNNETDEDYRQTHLAVTKKIDTPLPYDEDKEWTFSVGNWTSALLEPYTLQGTDLNNITDEKRKQNLQKRVEELKEANHFLTTSQIKKLPQLPSQTTSGKINIIISDPNNTTTSIIDDPNSLADFFPKNNTLSMKIFTNQSDTAHNPDKNNDADVQYRIYHHEKTHFDQWNYGGAGELLKTPINACKSDRLTETTAAAVEYLSIAQLYTTLKNQGINTLKINNKQQPIEKILERCPKLKEIVLNKGFNPKDKQSVREVVAAASEVWHDKKRHLYSKQNKENTIQSGKIFASLPWSEQKKLLNNEEKNYKKISKQMLKNIDIGQNTTVDLSHCQDLLDTRTTADAERLIKKHNRLVVEGNIQETEKITFISAEEFNEVDKYLTKIGLKTDREKMAYMAEQLKNIAYRQTDKKDTKLAAIISAHNNNISYPDMLEQTTIGNRTVIKAGDRYYDITEHLANPTKEQTKEIVNTATTAPIRTLTSLTGQEH